MTSRLCFGSGQLAMHQGSFPQGAEVHQMPAAFATCVPNRGSCVFLQRCLIHRLKRQPGSGSSSSEKAASHATRLLDSQLLLAPVERILKRFGAQTPSLLPRSFFFSPTPLPPPPPSPLRSNASSHSWVKAALKGLGRGGEGEREGKRKKKRCSSSPRLDPEVVEPRGKINS